MLNLIIYDYAATFRRLFVRQKVLYLLFFSFKISLISCVSSLYKCLSIRFFSRSFMFTFIVSFISFKSLSSVRSSLFIILPISPELIRSFLYSNKNSFRYSLFCILNKSLYCSILIVSCAFSYNAHDTIAFSRRYRLVLNDNI